MKNHFPNLQKLKISFSSDWKEALQNWITSFLFALCLLYFLFRLGGQKDLFMASYLLPLAGFCLFFGLTFNRLRVFFGVCIGFVGIILLQIIFRIDIPLPFLSIRFWHDFGGHFQNCLAWLVLPKEIGITKPAFFNAYAYVLLSMISVLTLWFLPIPLLNMFFLILPLFFIDQVTADPLWIFYLLLGLFCVYSSYAFRQAPSHRDQRAPVSFGLILIALTFILQLVIGPETFYHEPLSRALNNLRPIEGGNITSFSLKELGFYPQGSMRIGGPVKPHEAPYLKINSGPESFYLRGAAYDAFDGAGWSLATSQTLERLTWNDKYYDDFKSQESKIFWFPSAEDRDTAIKNHLFRPCFHQIISLSKTRNVFHGGRPGHFARLTEPFPEGKALSELLHQPNVNSSFMYSKNGMVVSDKEYEDFGIITEDYVAPVSLVIKQDAFQLFVPKKGKGERAYEKLVKEKDPALAEILYGKDLPFSDLIRELSVHFVENYEYTLNAKPIPESQNFIDNFLTNKKGYCVYYATAWSVLLKDIGYETRYAEGFVVPAAGGDQNTLTVRTLTGKQAHAWTEIFVNGLGWYPLEACSTDHMAELSGFTPGSDQDQNAGQTAPENSSEDSSEAEEKSEEKQSSERPQNSSEKTEPPNDTSKPSQSPPAPSESSQDQKPSNSIKGLLFGAIFGLFALILLSYAVFKRKRWKDRQDEKKLVPTEGSWEKTLKRIWKETERLAREDGTLIVNQDSAGAALKKIQTHYGLDQDEELEALAMTLEKVFYQPSQADEDLIRKLHFIYKTASLKKKKERGGFRWWLEEVLTTPNKAW